AEFEKLKNKVSSIDTSVSSLNSLKTKVENIGTAAANALNYNDVALAITNNDTNKNALATAIAANPNKLGESLATSIGTNNTVIQSLQDKLGTNTNFQDAMAATLSSDKYKVKFQGPRGADGNIGDAGSLKSNLFDQGRTMWCADGELCKIPAGKKGIDWGYGGSKIYDDGELHVASDNLIYLDASDVVFVPKNTALQFGNGFEREGNAGKIAYGRFDGNQDATLNIVGGGKNGQTRVVRVWDAIRIGDTYLRQDDEWLRLVKDKNSIGLDSYDKGLAAKKLWAKDSLEVAGRNIIAELDDLRNNVIRKDRIYGIQSDRGGFLSDQGGWKGNVGGWERMKFVQQ
ncbi:MAG: hypothetical protein EBU90_25765, partial [Proteobacteria bacterium]|nr:hypothetical protein [Pseudomonadota bacterium]